SHGYDIFLIVLASNHINVFAFFLCKLLIFIYIPLRAKPLFRDKSPYLPVFDCQAAFSGVSYTTEAARDECST
ncbi:hypothetical protein, partial [Klebsiella variicola]|uniref:hypothetical protein n=1 Tax=Klebsiella variicola TaxID=244366 RepID=UPI001953617A